jgi:hypothetical protein
MIVFTDCILRALLFLSSLLLSLQLATTPLAVSFDAQFILPSDIIFLPRSFLFQFLPQPTCLSPFPLPPPSVPLRSLPVLLLSASPILPSAHAFVVDVPPKLWRPKPADRYVPMDYSNDIDESVFLLARYDKAICHLSTPFSNTRSDIHLWDRERDLPEFEKNFVIGSDVDPAIRARIISIIESYWDCFDSAGVMKPILHFEFAIDTGGSAPLCCRKPRYGPHGSKIIMTQIQVLLDNGWNRPCYGPWGSSIVLAAKPHQEQVTGISDFVWRMRVSYR